MKKKTTDQKDKEIIDQHNLNLLNNEKTPLVQAYLDKKESLK